jgi:capsular polysaccharide biosynthesis protein
MNKNLKSTLEEFLSGQLSKTILKSIKQTIIHFLRNLPISSEIIGPPKNFYKTTWDWISSSGLDRNQVRENYIEIHTSQPIVRSKPKGLAKVIPLQFYIQPTSEFPKTFVAIVPSGRILKDDGIVISPDDKLLADVSLDLSSFTHLEDAGNHPCLHHLKLPPVIKIDKTVALLAAKWGQAYFHWMFDVLPRIHLLHCSGIPMNSIDYYIVNNMNQPFQKETLLSLGIPLGKVIDSNNSTHIKANKLILPSLPSIPDQVPKWVCDFIRKTFLSNKIEVDGIERIYISRLKASRRRISNEEEIIDLLSGLGFINIELELMSVAEQASLLSSAKVVIAPHGGGLTNIVFCSPGTKLIEFFSPYYIRPCYGSISKLQKYFWEPPEAYMLPSILLMNLQL